MPKQSTKTKKTNNKASVKVNVKTPAKVIINDADNLDNVEDKKPKKITKKVSNKVKKVEKHNDNNDADSSDVSDIDDNEPLSDAFNYDAKKKEINDEQDEEISEEYIQTTLLDRVIKYIKLDDLIKEKQVEHRKEMKVIKETKEQLEQYLIGYLDKVDEEYIQVGNKSTLVKTETRTKAAPKMEDISVCLVEGFRKYEIYEDDAEIKRVVTDFIKDIEDKREIKIRKYLKRTKSEDDKKEKEKGKKKNSTKQGQKSQEPQDNNPNIVNKVDKSKQTTKLSTIKQSKQNSSKKVPKDI